jgi:hypothetical protein
MACCFITNAIVNGPFNLRRTKQNRVTEIKKKG